VALLWRVAVMQQEDVAVRIFEHRVVTDPGVERLDEPHTERLQLGARRRYVLDVQRDRRMGLEIAADRDRSGRAFSSPAPARRASPAFSTHGRVDEKQGYRRRRKIA
jgi:hypothetical protein